MIQREIFKKITPWLGEDKILILKGARQVGKTTILKELQLYLKEKENSNIAYLLADDIDNQPIFSSLANLELYLKQFHNFDDEFIYLIIDEFQVIPEAGRFLKNIFDKHHKKLQLIVSGSSSLEINKNREFLTGRAIHFDIERINFKEFFDYSHKTKTRRIPLNNFSDLEIFYNTFKMKLDLGMKEYLNFGGYPEVITTKSVEDKKTILKNIIKTYIEKDIVNQLKIENISGFNNLIKILASQIGQIVNLSEVSNTINLSINTLKKYLDILIGTYIFNLVTPYYKNIRSELSKMPKGYILDFGIRNYLLRSFDAEEIGGEKIENFAYLAMLSQFEKEYLHYYKTISGSEIDFIVEKDNSKNILCEVKYRSKINIPLSMKNFEKKYPKKTGEKLVITKDLLKKGQGVYFIPVNLLPFIDLTF